MSIDRNSIKQRIETMNKAQQVEVLRMLTEMKGVVLNENNNGTFVNLTEIGDEHLLTLEKYIMYVSIQETHLDKDETEKTRIQKSFFPDNKDLSNVIL